MERSVRCCYAERYFCVQSNARDAPWMPSSPPSPPVAARRSLPSTMARCRVRWRASGDSHARPHSASLARTSSKKCPRKVAACRSFSQPSPTFDFHRESADQTDSTTLTVSTDSADSSPFKPAARNERLCRDAWPRPFRSRKKRVRRDCASLTVRRGAVPGSAFKRLVSTRAKFLPRWAARTASPTRPR